MADHSMNQSPQEESVPDADISPGLFISRMQASPTGEAVDELEEVIREMKERRLNYEDFISVICSEVLRLGQPTIQEQSAMEDVLFGRNYKHTRSPSSLTENPRMSYFLNKNEQCTYSLLSFLEDRSLALASLHASVNKLSESELFDGLPSTFRRPPPTYSPGDGLDTSGSSGRVRGGGGIAGPTILDTVNLAKLLAECAAPPSPLSRLPSDHSTSGSGVPQSPTSVSTAQQSFLTTGSPESAGATDTTRV